MRGLLLYSLLVACSAPDVEVPEPEPSISLATLPRTPVRLQARLRRVFPPAVSYPPWQHIERVGDWNGDGIVDLAIDDSAYPATPTVHVLSSRDGRELAVLKGAPEIVRTGHMAGWMKCFAPVGDVDADGRADVAQLGAGVAADGAHAGVLRVFGASKAEPIWKQGIDVPRGCMPMVLQQVGDLDRDGLGDIAVGMPPYVFAAIHDDALGDVGWVEARSSRDGRVLWRTSGPRAMHAGWELARCADVDRDGVEDVAVLAVPHSPTDAGYNSADPSAVIELHSGASGLLLGTAPNPISNAKPSGGSSQMRHHLRGGTDVDGDGVIDLVVRTVRREQINIVDVISGKSRDVIAQLTAHPDPNGREEWWFPSEIAVADDFDGDGLRDVLLGHDEVGTEQGLDYGAIYLHSTRTNQRLMAVWGDTDDVKLGGAIAWLGDTDGDGLPEFAALSTRGVRVWAIEREDAK